MNLTKEQVEKIFEIAGIECDYGTLTSNDVTKALIKIQDRMASTSDATDVNASHAKVLIIDDLELSTYQLSTLLKKIGVSPVIAHNKTEAISEIKRQKFDFLFVDLFLPDEHDGLDVMRAADEFRSTGKRDYKIIAISGTDDLNLVTDCFDAGVDEFVSKSAKWHDQILKIIINKNETDTRKNYIRYDIDETTAVYNVKSLIKREYIDELLTDISTILLAGAKNVILNLKDINTFPEENAVLLTDIFRKCHEVGGKFILLSPSEAVKNMLEYACLNDVITTFEQAEDAFALLNT